MKPELQPPVRATGSQDKLSLSLPALPSHVRYIDDYDDAVRTIRSPKDNDVWVLEFDTHRQIIDLSEIQETDLRLAVKWLLIWILGEFSPSTVRNCWQNLRLAYKTYGAPWFRTKFALRPVDWASYWDLEIRPTASIGEANFIKSLLYFFCALNLVGWHGGHRDYVRSLRIGRKASYKGVRSGKSILGIDEEAAIIQYLDRTSANDVNKQELADEDLLQFCLLCISYCEGLRPVQIARIAFDDLRVYTGKEGEPIVHFVAHRARSGTGTSGLPLSAKSSANGRVRSPNTTDGAGRY